MLGMIPPGFSAESRKVMPPLELILEVGRLLGAPGVRFLQLLAHTVDIPEKYRQGFAGQ